MTGHEVVRATANDDGSSIGLSGDNALINPLPGQYADYSIRYYGNGKMVSGWWNFSYLGYIEPDLINVTHTIAVPDSSVENGVFWMIVNTTNRWVVDGNHWWKDSWYPVWIETGVSEGSVVRIWTVNATVVKSETVTLKEMFVDC